jgi:hypothetical protein
MGKSIKRVRNKLSLSKLDSQRELLSHDLDLSQLAFITRKLPVMRFDQAVTGGEVSRTIEGASTVTLTVTDHYGRIRRSGRLGQGVDIKIDGLWFRLVKVSKRGDDITLTFEDREVAVLRSYDARRVVGWGKMRRSRFAEILVKEVKEFNIPFICPDLMRQRALNAKKDKKDKADNRDPGFGWQTDAVSRQEGARARRYADDPPVTATPPVPNLTIKGKPATTNQLENCEEVLDQGLAMLVKPKLLVCSIMTIIQESTANNIPFGDRDSVGLFQQRESWGSFRERMNPSIAARKFFERAIVYDKDHPNAEHWEVCQGVQISGFPKAYQQWRAEATKIVQAFGVAGLGGTSDTNKANNMLAYDEAGVEEFQFMRGRPKTLPGGRKGWEKENSWDCIVRLAEEVNWRCFAVSGKVYFTTETHLFKSAPRMRISEDSPGVNWIDFDYDVGKRNATIEVEAYINRWVAPPGTIIEIFNSGPANGRWLVTDVRRGFFDPIGLITAKKPRPRFPEPKKEDITGLWDNAQKEQPEYVPTPGYEPDQPRLTGKALRDAVLNHPQIEFTRPSQTMDIQMGLINDKVLKFLIDFCEAGFPVKITSLRTDHSKYSSSGRVSAHHLGKAVDMGNYTEWNPRTRGAMNWIRANQLALGFSQLIGPIDALCVPLGHYPSSTLAQHDDHIHVGWPT